MENLCICITHMSSNDSMSKLERSIKSCSGLFIIIVDDSGYAHYDKDHYKDYEEDLKVLIVINEYNIKPYLARKVGCHAALGLGFKFIQYLDSGDELIINKDYKDLLSRMVNTGADMAIYPQTVSINGKVSGDIYYSRLGDTSDKITIQKSILERSLSCSSCMKIYKTELLAKSYDYEELYDLRVFDLDDYIINLFYALHCNRLVCSTQIHYIYYLNGKSNTPTMEDINKKYEISNNIIRPLIKKYYGEIFPTEVLDYWITDRLNSYYKRQSN